MRAMAWCAVAPGSKRRAQLQARADTAATVPISSVGRVESVRARLGVEGVQGRGGLGSGVVLDGVPTVTAAMSPERRDRRSLRTVRKRMRKVAVQAFLEEEDRRRALRGRSTDIALALALGSTGILITGEISVALFGGWLQWSSKVEEEDFKEHRRRTATAIVTATVAAILWR